jgi:hypothetical protein
VGRRRRVDLERIAELEAQLLDGEEAPLGNQYEERPAIEDRVLGWIERIAYRFGPLSGIFFLLFLPAALAAARGDHPALHSGARAPWNGIAATLLALAILPWAVCALILFALAFGAALVIAVRRGTGR